MKFCPQCRAQFEDDMNFCLQDGTPLIEEEQLTNPTESFSESTLIRPVPPNIPPTLPPTQGYFNPANPPAPAQPVQPTEAFGNQPTAAQRNETTPVLSSFTVDSQGTRGRGGLIAAAFAGILLLLGTAIGGVWWFSKGDKPADVALANTNNQNSVPPANKTSDSGFSNGSNTAPLSNQTETNVRSTSNTNTKLSTPSPTETPKPTPAKEIEDKQTPFPGTPEKELSEETQPTSSKAVPKTISGGVVNGKATNLVKPAYPPAARAVNASGAVNVQVTIDEQGNVISASAVSGHPLLRASAVSAARASKFSPTILSGQAVKVTGVIVYNFVP
jgi:TonB family protein